MATSRVDAGRDPFGLRRGQRILDAVTFSLSPAGQRPSDAPLPTPRPDESAAIGGPAATAATIDADARSSSCRPTRDPRVVRPDAQAVHGMHLIDALHDQAHGR